MHAIIYEINTHTLEPISLLLSVKITEFEKPKNRVIRWFFCSLQRNRFFLLIPMSSTTLINMAQIKNAIKNKTGQSRHEVLPGNLKLLPFYVIDNADFKYDNKKIHITK
jgi:hypothetical protein